MTRKLYNSQDRELDPPLAAEIADVRGTMHGATERTAMPRRFDAVPHPDQPAVIITDVETGRATIVPLFAYGAVRAALNALFEA